MYQQEYLYEHVGIIGCIAEKSLQSTPHLRNFFPAISFMFFQASLAHLITCNTLADFTNSDAMLESSE